MDVSAVVGYAVICNEVPDCRSHDGGLVHAECHLLDAVVVTVSACDVGGAVASVYLRGCGCCCDSLFEHSVESVVLGSDGAEADYFDYDEFMCDESCVAVVDSGSSVIGLSDYYGIGKSYNLSGVHSIALEAHGETSDWTWVCGGWVQWCGRSFGWDVEV